ncbi:YuzD family protein [Bacillus solimangrovi]|uniref:Disulfide oxidoreductase n=1 Tax=Bacillus solimangrovi TaxID=1305675 RepID=A0A1E5LIU3_9BACI|nr:DUF1462 family protein [Bacillus solimangrovi]OEH93981.1 disulfide oxidoreductase [Bacillus solimangrovi]
MKNMGIYVTVYGSEKPCASCIHEPSSKETYEWLQAAIERKYDSEQLNFQYIDIESAEEQHQPLAERILAGEFFYPLVLIEEEIVAEGNPTLKRIYREIEKLGLEPINLP